MLFDRVRGLIDNVTFLALKGTDRIVSKARRRVFSHVKTPLPERDFHVGLVGCGHFVRYAYVPAFNKPGSLIFPSGLLSGTTHGAEKTQRRLRYETRVFSSFDELVDSGTQAVLIVAPNHMHYDYISKSLHRGLDVFCEKPAANTLKEAYQLRTLAQQMDSVLMIGFNQRYTDKIATTKKFLKEGHLGKVLKVHAYSNQDIEKHLRNSSWLADERKSGGGVLHNAGTHLVNMLLSLFGEVISVSARFQNTKLPPAYGEDTAFCHIRFESEVLAHLSASYVNAVKSNHKHFVIEGEKGLLESSSRQCDLVFSPHIGRVRRISCRMETVPDSVFNELQEFHYCAKNRKTPKTDISDFIRTQEVIEAAKQSAREGSVVTIGDMRSDIEG